MYPYRAVIMIVVQAEERNMYDQHFLSAVLRDKYPYLHSYNNIVTIVKVLIFPHLICVLKGSISYKGMTSFIFQTYSGLELLFLNFKHAWYYNCTQNVGRN
jgi:hypothetical protein